MAQDTAPADAPLIRCEPDHAALKARQRAEREGWPESFGLRIHRAISWVGAAERAADADTAFIHLWIAFNAAYARDIKGDERERFRSFFEALVPLDAERRLYDAVWERFSGPVRLLIDSPHVYAPFWEHHNSGGAQAQDWKARFERARAAFRHAFAAGDTAAVLCMLFDRLYVLRNQLVHGGATWGSRVNRGQLRDGAQILARLVPVILDVMMDNPEAAWGAPYFPVVGD